MANHAQCCLVTRFTPSTEMNLWMNQRVKNVCIRRRPSVSHCVLASNKSFDEVNLTQTSSWTSNTPSWPTNMLLLTQAKPTPLQNYTVVLWKSLDGVKSSEPGGVSLANFPLGCNFTTQRKAPQRSNKFLFFALVWDYVYIKNHKGTLARTPGSERARERERERVKASQRSWGVCISRGHDPEPRWNSPSREPQTGFRAASSQAPWYSIQRLC